MRGELVTEAGRVVEVIPYLVVMIGTVLTVAAILVLPRRGYRAINFTLDINAPRDRIWSLLVEAKGPGSWRPEVVGFSIFCFGTR